MRPNKQKILSTQPAKPGSGLKHSLSKSSLSTISYSNNFSQQSITNQPEFKLIDVIKDLRTKKSSLPFKMIQFNDKQHSRQNTTIVNDIKHSYKFASALSDLKTPLSSEEESREKSIPSCKSFSEILKDDEQCNNTTDTLEIRSDNIDLMYYGILPTKY